MFFKCKTFVNIAELLFTAIFSKENICKNGQKIEKCQNFKKNIFRQFTRYDDMSKFGWKHVHPKCFEHLIILTNRLPVKPPHFQGLEKKWRFLTNFFTSTKIFTCLVNKCWPEFFHEKKALIFPYTTLTSNFSYLLWSRKYFVLKIKYTRIRFSNNYLHIWDWISEKKSHVFSTVDAHNDKKTQNTDFSGNWFLCFLRFWVTLSVSGTENKPFLPCERWRHWKQGFFAVLWVYLTFK